MIAQKEHTYERKCDYGKHYKAQWKMASARSVAWRDSRGNWKSRNKSGFPTKASARKWGIEQEQLLNSGQISISNPEWTSYFDEWFNTYKKNKISKSTARLYEKTSERLHDFWNHTRISAVKRRQYQDFMNELGKTHAKETVQKTNSVIRACVKDAILDGLIPKDFTQRIELTWTIDKRPVEYLNQKEIKILVDYLKDGINPRQISRYMIITAIYTGARLGELMALTWDDINFNFKTITINKSYDYINNQVKEPKTKSSNRIIRVNQGLLDLLIQLKINHQSAVFMTKDGDRPGSTAVNKTLKKALKRNNIDRKNFHFHSLRHSHVALLLDKGVDLYAISQRLGHSNMTTTAKKYAYLIDEHRARSNDLIAKVLDEIDEKQAPVAQMLHK